MSLGCGVRITSILGLILSVLVQISIPDVRNFASRSPSSLSGNKNRCSLKKKYYLDCFYKRSEATFKAALIYYGEGGNQESLNRIGELLKERFFESTGRSLKLDLLRSYVIEPVQQNEAELDRFFSDYPNWDAYKKRRLYYYHKYPMPEVWVSGTTTGAHWIANDLYEKLKSFESTELMSELDALAVITDRQFEGLGIAIGRIAMTENPMDVAWTSKSAELKNWSDEKVVDELIHELGHVLGLNHAATQCDTRELKRGESLTTEEINEHHRCCSSAPSGRDVMSYCRPRDQVAKDFYFGFQECNRDKIKNRIIPALLSGGEWFFEDKGCQ